MGQNTFPAMSHLTVLNLDSCRIQEIHPSAFANLPMLRDLSLRQNLLFTVPDAVLLPSLKSLHFEGMAEMFLGGGRFTIGDAFFRKSSRPMRLEVIPKPFFSVSHIGEALTLVRPQSLNDQNNRPFYPKDLV